MDLKGREKPWNTQLPVWKKEGGGGIFSTTGSGRSETSAIFYTKCTGGGVLSCSESTPVLQGNHHILFTIVCGWRKKKKKEEGAVEGKKTCLFVQETGKRTCVYLSLPEKARFFFPPRQLLGASSLLHDCSFIWVSFSGRQTATPRLLLMMRADVRLVSMNIDVEDSLFHRRTERGKMAAL